MQIWMLPCPFFHIFILKNGCTRTVLFPMYCKSCWINRSRWISDCVDLFEPLFWTRWRSNTCQACHVMCSKTGLSVVRRLEMIYWDQCCKHDVARMDKSRCSTNVVRLDNPFQFFASQSCQSCQKTRFVDLWFHSDRMRIAWRKNRTIDNERFQIYDLGSWTNSALGTTFVQPCRILSEGCNLWTGGVCVCVCVSWSDWRTTYLTVATETRWRRGEPRAS